MTLLYKAERARGEEWRAVLAQRAPELPFRIWPETGDPAAVRYLAVWQPPEDMLAQFPNTELIFSVGAGVDQFDLAGLPPQIPLVRMLEPGIVAGMVEYVTLATLALHRHLPHYIACQRAGRWEQVRLVPAAARRVGVLGFGRLGEAVARALLNFGFPVSAWSRSARDVPGIVHHAGAGALPAFLAGADILICLLPLTNETRGILDAKLFAALPRGAGLVNAGRGGHLVQEDLLAALDGGQIGSAFLDVTDPEPLPQDHPLWSHPRVTITPHVASMTGVEAAVEFVLETISRHRQGLPLRGLVDRTRGY